MTLLNVLGVLGVLNVLDVLHVIHVLHVLNSPWTHRWPAGPCSLANSSPANFSDSPFFQPARVAFCAVIIPYRHIQLSTSNMGAHAGSMFWEVL